MPSIAQPDLDRKAIERADLLLDAAAGLALLNSLARAWYEQGWNAAMFGLNPDASSFWTADHQRGYLAAKLAVARTLQVVPA